MQAPSIEVTDPTSLVERLGACLDYVDGEQDHVLAALVSAAHEMAMARLAQVAVDG